MPVKMRGGREYLTVNERLAAAHGEAICPTGIQAIVTEAMSVGPAVIVLARVTFSDGRLFTGLSQVPFDATSGAEATNPVEVAETSAVGRALAMAGYFGSAEGIAGAEEMRAAQRLQATRASAAQGRPSAAAALIKPAMAASELAQTPEGRATRAQQWYAANQAVAARAGYEPVTFAADAPPDYVLDEANRMRAFLRGALEGQP